MIAKKWVQVTAITINFLLILLLYDILHYIKPFWFPIILLCLQASYYSSIIPTKFITYYSQNYADIIGSGLIIYKNCRLFPAIDQTTMCTLEMIAEFLTHLLSMGFRINDQNLHSGKSLYWEVHILLRK